MKRLGSLLTLKEREPSWDYRESKHNKIIISKNMLGQNLLNIKKSTISVYFVIHGLNGFFVLLY